MKPNIKFAEDFRQHDNLNAAHRMSRILLRRQSFCRATYSIRSLTMKNCNDRNKVSAAPPIEGLLEAAASSQIGDSSLTHSNVYFQGPDLIANFEPSDGPFVLLVDVLDRGAGYRRLQLHHGEPMFLGKPGKKVFQSFAAHLRLRGAIATPGRTALVKLLWSVKQRTNRAERLFEAALDKYRRRNRF